MSERRKQAIEQRRERIFAAAQAIIARDGYDGLTTRGLAQAAGLTVPTLYNLIGDKDTIVTEMCTRGVEAVWERLDFDKRASPLEMADAIIDEAFHVISEDVDFHRAIFLSLERVSVIYAANPDSDDPGARAANRSVEMAEYACRAAQQRGLLRGNVAPRELGQQMFLAYRGPLWDWINRAISAAEMIRQQRRGFYLLMAADATDDFRTLLLERIADLSKPTHEREAA